jgi:hypothetical protein
MWADELFDPDYYDTDPHPQAATSSRRKQKFQMEMKKRPPFFHQSITCYNKNILHAITGEEMPYRIGSKDESRFYVVMENDPTNYKDARRLFFYSPEEYENATGIQASQHSKDRFRMNQWVLRNDPSNTHDVKSLFYANPAEYRRVTGIF